MRSSMVASDHPATDTHIRLPADIVERLQCPVCGERLQSGDDALLCIGADCGRRFPLVGGIPVLIHEENSIFSFEEFTRQEATFFVPRSGIEQLLERRLPDVSRNFLGRRNYIRFAEQLLAKTSAPTVLVIGGSILGDGMDVLLSYPAIRLIESDVAFGARTKLICDAHDLPFRDGSFDGVIAQAVLEHVADPYRCVAEVHRVLNDHGLMYAETPFMQQVHGGRYDFTRFTLLGHRRLFRNFEELASGAICGPGMALAWANLYFLLSFTTTKWARKAVRLFSRLLFFPLTYVDYYLIRTRASLDAASGFYFMGRKSNALLSDRDLIQLYRGGV